MWTVSRVPVVATAAAVFISTHCSAETEIDALAAELSGYDVVILGEVHDNPEHHRVQGQLIERLHPEAIVFEMLSPEQAAAANETDQTGLGLAAVLDWADSGWPDWELYEPVFDSVGDAQFYGMALPRAEVRRAVTEGAAQVFGPSAEEYGLDRDLPSEQQDAREALQMEAHCNALPEEMLSGMVEAQRLRDAGFARTVLDAVDTSGTPVVVITGTGHARTDWGIPAALRIAAPQLTVSALGQFEADPEEPAPFDRWLVADPAERPDPCAAFK